MDARTNAVNELLAAFPGLCWKKLYEKYGDLRFEHGTQGDVEAMALLSKARPKCNDICNKSFCPTEKDEQ